MATSADRTLIQQVVGAHDAREHYVICADDDPEFVKSLELFLPDQINGKDGDGPYYEFLFFTDPREAIEAVREILAGRGVLAMVISDQQMPQMKGTTFLAEIRKQCPDCICVLLTGHAGLDSAITAINERLLDKYVTKPIENDHDFTVSIKHLLQRFRMQRTIENQHRTLGDLYRFANMLNATGDLQKTLDHVVAFASETLGSAEVSISMLEGCELVPKASTRGTPGPTPTRIRLEDHVIQELRSSRGAKRADRLDQVSWLGGGGVGITGPLTPPVLHAALASGDQVLGVIVVGGTSPELAIDDKDLEILTYVADTASIAIHNQLQHRALAEAYAETQVQAVALATANERLQVLDQLKSDFLAFVCHELRTPLSALAAVDLLKPGAGEDQQAEVISIVRDGYARLEEFIQRGLDYVGRIATGRTESWEVVDFKSALRSAIAETPDLESPEVNFASNFPDGDCLIDGNRADLVDVARIFLDNAVRFSPRDKWIRAALELREDRLVFEVTDRGEGFALEMAEEIFRPFTIADSSHHQTGCALSLAKAAAIIKVHRGEVQAASAGIGKGATFSVSLPLARPGQTPGVKSSQAESPIESPRRQPTGESQGARAGIATPKAP